jgi:hypothetical protein
MVQSTVIRSHMQLCSPSVWRGLNFWRNGSHMNLKEIGRPPWHVW